MTGNKVKEMIDKLGITQRKLAELMEVTPQTISAILTAKDIRTSTIERISDVLEVPVSFFYTDPDDTNSAHATGDNSVAIAGNNNITSTSADNAVLHERIRMLEKIVQEKERLITVLMEK